MRLLIEKPDIADKIVENRHALGAAVATILVGFAAGGVVMARGRIVAGMAVAAAATTAGLLVSLPAVDAISSENDAAVLMPRLVAARRPGERVILAGRCSEDFSVVLALGERVTVWGASRELGMGHFTEVTPPSSPIPDDPYDVGGPAFPLRENPWLFDDARLETAWRSDDRTWFVGRPADVKTLRAKGLCVHVFGENESRVIAVNRPPLPAR
jgi:hypothetical protein